MVVVVVVVVVSLWRRIAGGQTFPKPESYPFEHLPQMFLHVILSVSVIRSGVALLLELGGVHARGSGVAAGLHVLVPHRLQALVHQAETNTRFVGQGGTHRDGTAHIRRQIKFRPSYVDQYTLCNLDICLNILLSSALKSRKNFHY